MKMTSSKVFASCVAIVCLASVATASPVQKPVSATSENPIIEKRGCRVHKHLVGQNVVDLKTYDSMLITNEVAQKPAVHEPMMSQKLFRQRRTSNAEEEQRMRNMLDRGYNDSSSVDSKQSGPVKSDSSNEIEDSKQSNEVQSSEQSNEAESSEQSNEAENSEQSNEAQNSEQSNEAQNSEQSNEAQNSEQSNEVHDSQQSNESTESEQANDNDENIPRELPEPESSPESEETERPLESGENTDDSPPTDDDKEESDNVSPPKLQRASF